MISMPAVCFQQGGVTSYIGALPARALTELMIVDQWHHEEGWNLDVQGYQRQIYEDHIAGLRQFISQGSNEILPTAVICTVRIDETIGPKFESNDGVIGQLVFQEGTHVYIVDGQ